MQDFGKQTSKTLHQAWPEGETESVRVCPVCESNQRSQIFSNLTDDTFMIARGVWSLHRCECCRSVFLDPRPNKSSIHKAYLNYYTHQVVHSAPAYASLNPLKKLKCRLYNGYLNSRFGASFFPASVLGILVPLFSKSRLSLDTKYRNLPPLRSSEHSLLDIGCGAGTFLRDAKALGWNVSGLDFDENAVKNATRSGIPIYLGGVEYFDGQSELFDVITLSHVIEHVHNPRDFMRSCLRLLKPGGWIWIETPNIESFGFKFFGSFWRGLEVPRHLVLFNYRSLVDLLTQVGFQKIDSLARPSPVEFMFKTSFELSKDVPIEKSKIFPKKLKLLIVLVNFLQRFFVENREFITISAMKKY